MRILASTPNHTVTTNAFPERFEQLTQVAVLGIVTTLTVVLLCVRIWLSGSFNYAFLLWNLWLAWLPLGFAWMALRSSRLSTVLWSGCWLIFFPNALYLATDLIHLRAVSNTLVWLDWALLLSALFAGLFLGLVSLSWMQSLVDLHFGRVFSWVFVVISLALGSYGVYIGRFLRWNSWDIVVYPRLLLSDLFRPIVQPFTHWHVWAFSLALMLIFLFVYLTIYLFSGKPIKRQVA